MAGAHSINFVSVSSILILLLHTRSGNFAPTHHLKIGVAGNTPTLIVTSAEIGITPKNVDDVSKDSMKFTTTTSTATLTTTLQPPKWLHKNNQIKLKSKSQKSLYEKKREKIVKEKSATFHGKSSLPTAAIFTANPLEVTTQKANIQLTSKTQTRLAVNNKQNLETSIRKVVAIETDESNEFALKTKISTLSTSKAATLQANTLTSNRAEIALSNNTAKGTTTLGILPHQTQPSTLSIIYNAPAVTTVTTSTTTTQPLDENATKNADLLLGNVANTNNATSTITTTNSKNDNIKILPKAFLSELNKTAKSVSTVKMTTAIGMMESSTTETPVLTTEVAVDSNSEMFTTSTSIATTSTTTSEANKIIKIAHDNKQVQITSQESSTASKEKPSIFNMKSVEATAIVEASTITPIVTTIATNKSTITPHINNEEEAEHAVIKLIDLEKNLPISLDELRTNNAQSQVNIDDGGHDGVKQTKKKQLLDKHFMPDTIDFVDALTTMKSLEMNGNGNVLGEQQNIENPTLITPTLMPLHNSYLGPIIMEERTFSVMHNTERKPKPQKHEASIASKLHDGRIVEIIAPTALLEEEPQKTIENSREPNKSSTKQSTTSTNTQQEPTVFSTTVFQVQDAVTTSTTHKPHDSELSKDNEKQASKISDIQIEIFDNVAAASPTGFLFDSQTKQTDLTPLSTTKPTSLHPTTQERFTQYVIDRTESSTADTTVLNSDAKFLVIGKPEPAAIEIHINVSEGVTNQSEDLEFSFQQTESAGETLHFNSLTSNPPSVKSESWNERGDDILIVEIIDTGENSTDIQTQDKPVFTFRTDPSSDVDLKNVKFEANNDELFLADAKPPILPPPPPLRSSNADRDSDTIFYISNTEVKVGESSPKSEETLQAQMRRTKLENQFFPANYVASTNPNTATGLHQHEQKNKNAHQQQQPTKSKPKHLYEEDIILSSIRNTADSLKIFRSQGEATPPLDVTYVGESVIEVEQSSGAGIGITTTTAPATLLASQAPDVIIQPAILPEMSIGVPVIGELPPQIELKEIDFMPNEANQQHSGENNDIEENLSASNNNDLERLVESSIQYGGDLIDEGADGGFDGIEGSYPFGNIAVMRRKATHKSAADYAHFQLHHSVNNLRKDELSVDVDVEDAGTGETPGNDASENITISSLEAAGVGTVALQSFNGTKEALLNSSHNEFAHNLKNITKKLSLAEQQQLNTEQAAYTDLVTIIVAICLFVFIIIISIFAACISKDVYAKFHGETLPCNFENLPNGGVNVDLGDKLLDESSIRQTASSTNADFFELMSTNERIMSYLPVPDANSTMKPSNFNNNTSTNFNCNSNSLNIVNEKQIVDNFVNRSKAAEEDSTRKIMQPNSNACPIYSVPDSRYTCPNGSVTKMTLKNNHLIVETEERNDISRNARETKMHYNASEKDGVFVVEVARGIDSKLVSENTLSYGIEQTFSDFQTKTNSASTTKSPTRKFADEPAVLNSHEQVQIHEPPTELHNSNTERSLHQIDEVEEETILSPKTENKTETVFSKNVNTGLSQSDLSSTSSNDSNKRYSYGNQELYTNEQIDSTTRSPNNMSINAEIAKNLSETKDDDHKSENGKGFEHTPVNTNPNNNEEELSEFKQNGEIMNNDTSAQSTDDKKEVLQNGKDEKDILETVIAVEIATSPEVKETATLTTNATELTLKTEAKNSLQSMNTENEVVVEDNDAACKEDSIMSVSEIEFEMESVTTETDPTHKLNNEQSEMLSNGLQLDATDTDAAEYAYDSLMSLPDPPSNEEMTNFSDFNGIEINPLDSLPPPPPALLSDENINMPDIVAEIKFKSCPQPIAINGNIENDYNGHETLNGHQQQQLSDRSSLPPQMLPPLMEEVNSNNKILSSSPLTPPESPPSSSSPLQFSSGVLGLNERICAPVAVNVNVS